MTIQDEQQLDCFHRKQLRQILMIRWPRKIRNNELYEKNPFKTCVYWGNQTEMEPTWTHPQTRQKKNQPEKPRNSCLTKGQIRNSEEKKSKNLHHSKSWYKEDQEEQSSL